MIKKYDLSFRKNHILSISATVLAVMLILPACRETSENKGASSTSSNASKTTSSSASKTVAASSPKVQLSWNASTGGVGQVTYSIFRNGVLLSKTIKTEYQDSTTVAGGGDYKYVVTASDTSGQFSNLGNVATVSR